MDIRKMYQDKLVSASEAAKTVKSGDWVDYAWTTSTPVAVDAEIAKRLPELYNVNFRGGILMWVPEIFKIENPVFRRSTRKVPSFSSRHFFISFPASRFFLYLQQIFNALLGLFLLKKFF